MKSYILVIVAIVASLFMVAPVWAGNNGSAIPFSRAKIIVEFNASAEDVGIQVLVDGEPWKQLRVCSPNGRRVLDITGKRSLGKQGLTELFFESSEPSLVELPLPKFLARFPDGKYELEGETIDGMGLEGTAALSHVIPAGPGRPL